MPFDSLTWPSILVGAIAFFKDHPPIRTPSLSTSARALLKFNILNESLTRGDGEFAAGND